MSICQAAILQDVNLPTIDQIEAHSRSLGFDVVFLNRPNLRGFEGPIIATLEAQETGFHSRYLPANEFNWMPDELTSVGECLFEIVTPGGDFTAGLFANVFLRSFCELGNAGWWYIDNAEFFQLPETTPHYFEEQISSYRTHIARKSIEAEQGTVLEKPAGFFSRLFGGKVVSPGVV